MTNKKTNRKLAAAAARGDVQTLASLLAAGVDPDTGNDEGDTPLMLAAENGRLSAVEQLLAAGASADARDSSGSTALLRAANRQHTAVIERLWHAGADVSVQPGFGLDMLQAAALMARVDWAERLLEQPRISVNQAVNNYTALHQANDAAMIDWLLAHGADVHAQPAGNQSALVHAIRMRASPKVLRLLAHARREVMAGSEGYVALCEAADGDDAGIVEALLALGAPPNPPDRAESAADNGWSPLMIAARHDHVAMVQMLLARGAHINPRGFMSTPLLHAIESRAHRCVDLLLARGADCRDTDYCGASALDRAIIADSPELVVRLLRHGVAVPAATVDAVFMMVVRTDAVDLAQRMLALGANLQCRLPRRGARGLLPGAGVADAAIDAKLAAMAGACELPAQYDSDDLTGFTPLMLAADQSSPQMLAWLLTHDADVNACSGNGCTALICAAADDAHALSVQRLLALGADPNQAEHAGWTPLFAALRSNAVVNARALIAAGAHTAYADGEGYTSLMAAARGGCVAMIPELLASGVPVNAEWDGQTALELALTDAHADVATLIEKAGGIRGSQDAGGASASGVPRADYFEALVAQLQQCMPLLDAPALLRAPVPQSLVDEYGNRTTVLQWLMAGLSAQRLMDYHEWKQYWGEWPDLAMIDAVPSDRYDPEEITGLALPESMDDDDEGEDEESAPGYDTPPYVEVMNHVLKPHGLRLVSLALENLYLMCVRDDEASIDALAALLDEAGLGLVEHEPLSMMDCRKRYA